MNNEDRLTRLEIITDALIEALIKAGVITAEEIQTKIEELSFPKEDE